MSRGINKKKKKQSKSNFALVFAIVIILMFMVSVKCIDLKKKQDVYQAHKQELQEQIDREEARTEELVELRKYVQTDSYAQEVAEERLGLVREGEILFKTTK